MVTRAEDNPFPSLLFVESPDPATPDTATGRLFLDDTDGLLKWIDDAGTVTAVSLGAAGLSDPMTTRGDIIVRNASNVTARLAIGSTGKVLSSNGTDVSWQTPGAGYVFNGARAVMASPSSIANATWSAPPMATETFDSGAWHDTVTNNSYFTVPTGVTKVLCMLSAGFAQNSTGNRYLAIRLGGVQYGGSIGFNGSASLVNGQPGLMLTDVVDCVATNRIELFVHQDSGGALNLNFAQMAVVAVG